MIRSLRGPLPSCSCLPDGEPPSQGSGAAGSPPHPQPCGRWFAGCRGRPLERVSITWSGGGGDRQLPHARACRLPRRVGRPTYQSPAAVWWGSLHLSRSCRRGPCGHPSPLTPGSGSSWASGVWGVPRQVCEERRAVRVPLKAVRCSLRERRRGMSVNKQTQAGPGTEKGGSGSSAASPAIPEEDDPDGGIDPGTPFAQIADEWICPICGARKTDFHGLEAERRSRRTGKTDPCSTDTTAS